MKIFRHSQKWSEMSSPGTFYLPLTMIDIFRILFYSFLPNLVCSFVLFPEAPESKSQTSYPIAPPVLYPFLLHLSRSEVCLRGSVSHWTTGLPEQGSLLALATSTDASPQQVIKKLRLRLLDYNCTSDLKPEVS